MIRSECLHIIDKFSRSELAIWIGMFGAGSLPRITNQTERVHAKLERSQDDSVKERR